MTSPPAFHNTIYLHGPHDPVVTWVERAARDDGFASINTSGASLLVCTVAEADALILAGAAAKDLLLGAQEPAPLTLTPDAMITQAEIAADDAVERAIATPGQPTHDLTAAPLPAAGHCPICSGPLAADGSHISANSGAHIPAEPQQVST